MAVAKNLPKARELFLHAVGKLPPQQWDDFLAQECDGDTELAQQVQKLLKAHRESGSFLDRPAVGPTVGFTADSQDESAPINPESPGTIIGPFKLLQQIGEGGMGVVWMAEQTKPVQRMVALKIIKPGMDSQQLIARFEAERQALAMMDHVNIARVFDGGATDTGRPYFVMELVHGVRITKYCDDQRLTPRERLELFLPVCQAIQHAHQKGIIHRDIKPSNVMVTLYDGKPVPKVIDFGVAKAMEQKLTERTLFTKYGTMVGTLEYMSPEQAEMSALGVDTRSDIYSLGVLLYELLTGSTPLSRERVKQASYADVIRMIKEEEPNTPSTRLNASGETLATIAAQRTTDPGKLAKMMRGELDWIVMKCLEKDRDRRYATASDLVQDLQCYLADEPVQAFPPSRWYRFRKFARRNSAALAFGVLATSGLMALVLALAMMLAAVTHERDLKAAAVQDRDHALAQETLALKREQAALAQKAEALTEAESQLKQAIIGMEATLVATKSVMDGKPAPDYREAAQMLAPAVTLFGDLAATPPASLQARERFFSLAQVLVDRFVVIHRFEQAAKIQQARNLLWERTVVDFPAEPFVQEKSAFELAEGHRWLGRLYLSARRFKDAEIPCRRALVYWEAVVKKEEDETVRDVWIWHKVKTHIILAAVLSQRGQPDESEAQYRTSLKLLALMGPTNPHPDFHLPVRAQARAGLADLLRALGRIDQARGFYSQAIEDYDQILKLKRPSSESCRQMAWLLACCPEAEFRQLPRGLALAQEITKREPLSAKAWRMLGIASTQAGNHQAAIEAFEKSLKLRCDENEFDLFSAAMAHWRAGDKMQASNSYGNAIRSKNRQSDPEIRELHAEAAALLGLPVEAAAKEKRGAWQPPRLLPE